MEFFIGFWVAMFSMGGMSLYGLYGKNKIVKNIITVAIPMVFVVFLVFASHLA